MVPQLAAAAAVEAPGREKPHRPAQTPAQASTHGRALHNVLTGPAEGTGRLLNYLVGSRQHRFRDGKAERLGGFVVYDEMELSRSSDR